MPRLSCPSSCCTAMGGVAFSHCMHRRQLWTGSHMLAEQCLPFPLAAQAAPSEKDTVVFKLKVDCKWKDRAAGEIENEKGDRCLTSAKKHPFAIYTLLVVMWRTQLLTTLSGLKQPFDAQCTRVSWSGSPPAASCRTRRARCLPGRRYET